MGIFSKVIKTVDKWSGGLLGDISGSSQQTNANQMAMTAWNLANDYNHPIAQMERLKAAGLNPNLVYGSGSVSGNTTSQPALVGGGVSTPVESAFRGLQNVLSLAQGNATLDNTHAQTRASNASAVASGAQAANLNAQAALNEQKLPLEKQSMIADIDYKQALTDKTRAEADLAQGEANMFGAVGGAKGAGMIGKGIKSIGRFWRGLEK